MFVVAAPLSALVEHGRPIGFGGLLLMRYHTSITLK